MVLGDSGFDGNTSTTDFEERWSTKSIKNLTFGKLNTFFFFLGFAFVIESICQ